MQSKTALKYRATKALVSNGTKISTACRKTGLSTAYFYALRAKDQAPVKEDVKASVQTAFTAAEPPLEEQVIASDLSSKAKVKILTTLLNA